MRVAAKEMADNFGTTGWIKNLPDGRVELLAEGRKDQLENLLKELKQKFEIAKTEIQWSENESQFKDFNICYN